MNKARKEVELLIYKEMDILDPTESNSGWYKKKFAKMTDEEFIEFFKQDFPLKFQTRIFEIEPKMDQIVKALDNINVPLTEKITLPFLYKSKDGKAASTLYEALTIYVPIKKEKQFIAKKNSMSTNISNRDMKTGLLMNQDKNGNTSDREMECLAVMDCPKTMDELSTYRADAMNAKAEFYNNINVTGMVKQQDVSVSKDDSLSRNIINTYLIGAHINSNLLNEGNFLPYTLNQKEKKTEREA